MTQRNLIELLREDFPGKGDVYLRILANQAMSEYAFETLINRASTTQAMDGSNIRFALPADCIRLERVFDNDTGAEMRHAGVRHWRNLPDGEASWWVENGQLVVGYNDDATDEYKPLASTYTFELRYRNYPATLTAANMDDELDLPKPMHQGIEARLRERLSVGDKDAARYWHAVWRDFIRKGKIYANEQQDGGDYTVQLHDNTMM